MHSANVAAYGPECWPNICSHHVSREAEQASYVIGKRATPSSKLCLKSGASTVKG